ncbi:hypothetical protein [Mesorhizobium caraganae]
MPYATEKDLPPSVSAHLPLHVREIFRAEGREEIAHRVACKEGSDWVPL